MATKFKLTGFARFFFAMVIIIPLAYFGASYYNGEDGVANFKEMIGIDIDPDEETTTISADTEDNQSSADKGDSAEVTKLLKRINELEKENEKLNQSITSKEQTIMSLKNVISRLRIKKTELKKSKKKIEDRLCYVLKETETYVSKIF